MRYDSTIYIGNEMAYELKIDLYDSYNNLVFRDRWVRKNLDEKYTFDASFLDQVQFGYWMTFNNLQFNAKNTLFRNCTFDYELVSSHFSNTRFDNCIFNAPVRDLVMENHSGFDYCTFNNMELSTKHVHDAHFYGCVFQKVKFRSISNWSVFSHCAFIDCDFGSTYIDWVLFCHNHLSRKAFDMYETSNSDVIEVALQMAAEGVPNNDIMSFLQL